MSNFDELKQKAKDTMETIADKSVELYKIAEEKTKIIAKITKLSTEIALEKGNVRKLYREIGKRYYELHNASPEEELAQTCAEVKNALECIVAKQKEVGELKNALDLGEKGDMNADEDDDDIEVEIIIEDLAAPSQAVSDDKTEDLDENTAEAEDVVPPAFKL